MSEWIIKLDYFLKLKGKKIRNHNREMSHKRELDIVFAKNKIGIGI